MFGRCRGSFSIGKDLSVFGTTNRLDPTILDGGGREGVLFVNERVTVTLTLNDSRLTANTARGGGGGLFSEGVATLNRSRVTGNTAAYGGGILSVNTLPLNQTVVSGQRPRQLRLLAAVTGL